MRAHGQGGCREAGRDPADGTVWSCFATIGDHIDEPLRLKKTVGRLATYLQAYGDLMVTTNDWDPAVLDSLPGRSDGASRSAAPSMPIATTDQLEHIATLLPDEWLAPAATGTPAQCAAAVRRQIRPRRRRRDHARCIADRTRADHRGLLIRQVEPRANTGTASTGAMTTLVLTVIGNDRTGLVDALAGSDRRTSGQLGSEHMARLAGQFAGIVVVHGTARCKSPR